MSQSGAAARQETTAKVAAAESRRPISHNFNGYPPWFPQKKWIRRLLPKTSKSHGSSSPTAFIVTPFGIPKSSVSRVSAQAAASQPRHPSRPLCLPSPTSQQANSVSPSQPRPASQPVNPICRISTWHSHRVKLLRDKSRQQKSRQWRPDAQKSKFYWLPRFVSPEK